METLMMKAAAAKAARMQRTLEKYGVQATATSASSSDALDTAGGKAVTVISVSWSVHEHARNASGASGIAMRSAAAKAAGLSSIEDSMSMPMKTMPLTIGNENRHGDVNGLAQNVCQAARDSSVDAQEKGV
eukprot:1404414-Pleurochrysis_carterae.AAC.1